MTISRSQIGSQMKGGTMYKKKPVKKKMIGGILPMAAKGIKEGVPMGILGMAAMDKDKRKKMMKSMGMMNQGGKVTRGDGACTRGKTRGTIR